MSIIRQAFLFGMAIGGTIGYGIGVMLMYFRAN